MKTKFSGILTLLLAFVVQFSFAQEKTITGTVSDESGPLPSVSVIIKGTSQGTETDFDGNYSIQAKTGDILIFSFVGMKTKEMTIGSSNTLNVILEGDNVLEEVVVTAQGIKREKKSLGFSQQSVKGETLTQAKETDISNALAGKISGVQIVGNSSTTFDNSSIKLRGNSNVLYVVDGIRVYSTSDVNPENIADISVLKGLSATAIYGPDGRNGVVIITTKSAKSGVTKFTLDVNTSVNSVSIVPEYQNEYGGGYSQTWNTFTYNPATDPADWAAFDGQKIPEYNADESWGPRLDGTLVRHWDSWVQGTPEFGELRPWSPTKNDVKDFFEQAITNLYTLGFSKGGDDYKINTTVSLLNANGIVPNTNRKSVKLGLNLSYDITDKFEFFVNGNYENRITKNNVEQNYGNLASNMNQWWQRQLDMDRLRNYRRNGQLVSWNIRGPRDSRPLYWDMPYFHSYENLKNQYKNSAFGKIGGTYKFTDNFNAVFEARTTFHSYLFNDRATTASLLDKAFYAENHSRNRRTTYFGMLNYNNQFNEGLFDVAATLGIEHINNRFNSLNASTVGDLTIPDFYNLAGSKDPVRASTNEIRLKRRGLFFKGSLGYKSTIYFDGSYRYDWSSTANPNDNRVTTYGSSLSFLAHKVLPKNDILNFAKFRVGYASAPYFPRPYQVASTYNSGTLYQGNGTLSVSNTQSNPLLKGGLRKELEIGTELQLFNNRIALDFTYFDRVDSDLPVGVNLDGSTGYSRITVNSGKQTSNGIELGIDADILKSENLKWNLAVNFATLTKFVDKLYPGVDSRDLSTYTSNLKLQERVGEEWGLFYGRGYAKDANGNTIFRRTSSGRYIYARHPNKLLGSLLPDYTGGITSSLTYKNLNLNLGFDFQKGGLFYSRTERYYLHSGLAPITAGLNDKGNPKRDPVANGGGERIVGVLQTGTDPQTGLPISDGTPVDAYVNPKGLYNLGNLGNIYESNVHDATYFKLRSIKLSYNFNSSFIEKLSLQKASLGFYVNNAWLIYSKVPWIDPSELEKRSGINWAENGQLPPTRTIGLNLNLTF